MLDRILIGSSSEPTDTNFKNVTLLLHGDGSNGAQNNTFIDSSTNNFTITRNGNTTQGSFSPYGSNWSNYFDGNGDYLSLPTDTALSFGTGDWTIEAWIFPTSSSGNRHIFSGSDVNGLALYLNTSGKIAVAKAGVVEIIASTTTIAQNTYTHVAASRSGNTFRIFVNGTLEATVTSSQDFTGSNANKIGFETGATAYQGYISNLRILKGTALYTSTFTPSTTPLTAITNTSLLTCADNRFRDGSTNNFTITRNGDVKVTNFAPFAPSSAYSTTTNGGSIFADGNGDYLLLPSSSNLAIGTSQFWVEAWVYMSQAPSDKFIILGGDTNNNSALTFRVSTTQITLDKNGIAGWNSSSTTIPVGAWAHVAIGRDSSNTVYFFLNGNVVSTTSVSDNFSGETRRIAANSDSGTYGTWFNGYISGARIVKGSCLYTSSFTPPTSPVSAVTNTQLLLNATNAAIFDNSMKNDLETVGNAQISTSVKKFGTGSMYFDGSGDWLQTPSSQVIPFGTGDFTIEAWIYTALSASEQNIAATRTSAGTVNGWSFSVLSNGNIRFYSNSIIVSAGSVSANTWTHVAITRSGTTVRAFVNGVVAGTGSSSEDYSRDYIAIGSSQDGAQFPFTGYIDELRITKGVARYTANFTAPTAPFPNK